MAKKEPNNFPKGFYEFLNPPVSIQESLKDILSLSDSLRRYTEQNRSILDQVFKQSAVNSSTFESLKLSALPEVSKIFDTQVSLTTFEKLKNSLIFDQVNDTNLSIARLLEAVDRSNISKFIEQATYQSDLWKQKFLAIDAISGSFRRYDLVLQSHFADISKFSTLSQISLDRLSLGDIGNSLKVNLSTQSALQNTFVDFAKSYSKLFASFSNNPSSIISLPPIVSGYPAVEFFSAVSVAKAVIVESDESELNFEFEVEKLEEAILPASGYLLQGKRISNPMDTVVLGFTHNTN